MLQYLAGGRSCPHLVHMTNVPNCICCGGAPHWHPTRSLSQANPSISLDPHFQINFVNKLLVASSDGASRGSALSVQHKFLLVGVQGRMTYV